MKKSLIILFLFLSSAVSSNAQIVSLSKKEIKNLKKLISKNDAVKAVYLNYKKTADKALLQEPHPIEKIRSQGLLMGDPLKTASLKAVADASKIYALALTYNITGKDVYLNQAVRYLLAWSNTNKATGDPIDETKLEDAIVGYDFIRSKVGFTDKNKIDKWLNEILEAELHSVYANPLRGTSKNNWNSHRIKIMVQIAQTLQVKSYNQAILEALTSHLAINLYPNGKSLDFEERDAFHYHLYDIEPLLQTVIVLKRANLGDYFNFKSSTGSSIKKAVDFLVPYVKGEKAHVEFVNSKASFDKARAKNNEKGYKLENFEPLSGIYALALAAYFDEQYAENIKNIVNEQQFQQNWQLILNKVRDK